MRFRTLPFWIAVMTSYAYCADTKALFGPDVAFRLRYTRHEGATEVTGHGTAFAFAPKKLLTAAHNCLDNANKNIEELRIEYAGEWIRCKVLTLSVEADVAVLESPIELPFSDFGEDPHEDAGLIMYGSLHGEPITRDTGLMKTPYAMGARFLASANNFGHGRSGGPVIQGKKIVGMMVSGIPKYPKTQDPMKASEVVKDQFYFVPVSALRYFAEAK